jgi:hypothetical protein
MIEIEVSCIYYKECADRSGTKCKKCRNNTIRNRERHYFKEANDNPIPEVNPRVTYSGPAEQTAGYPCPVCGGFTNPYAMRDSRCGECGFKLNVG